MRCRLQLRPRVKRTTWTATPTIKHSSHTTPHSFSHPSHIPCKEHRQGSAAELAPCTPRFSTQRSARLLPRKRKQSAVVPAMQPHAYMPTGQTACPSQFRGDRESHITRPAAHHTNVRVRPALGFVDAAADPGDWVARWHYWPIPRARHRVLVLALRYAANRHICSAFLQQVFGTSGGQLVPVPWHPTNSCQCVIDWLKRVTWHCLLRHHRGLHAPRGCCLAPGSSGRCCSCPSGNIASRCGARRRRRCIPHARTTLRTPLRCLLAFPPLVVLHHQVVDSRPGPDTIRIRARFEAVPIRRFPTATTRVRHLPKHPGLREGLSVRKLLTLWRRQLHTRNPQTSAVASECTCGAISATTHATQLVAIQKSLPTATCRQG